MAGARYRFRKSPTQFDWADAGLVKIAISKTVTQRCFIPSGYRMPPTIREELVYQWSKYDGSRGFVRFWDVGLQNRTTVAADCDRRLYATR